MPVHERVDGDAHIRFLLLLSVERPLRAGYARPRSERGDRGFWPAFSWAAMFVLC
ncbi:hypothetical protein D3C80_191140 [compost metagenome]